MAINSCDPCNNCIPANVGEDFFRQAALAILCQILAAVGGGEGPWENGEATLARTAATGAGSVTAGAYAASIANVGSANGTVLGVAILPGQVLNFAAVENPVTRDFELLPAIAYDGTGTTLHITVEAT